MTPETARRTLVAGRAGVGWLAVVLPGLLLRLIGVRGALRRELRYVTRLFGIREVLMAYQLYQAERAGADPDELEEALRQGIMVDAGDALCAMALGRSASSFPAAAVGMIGAGTGIALGVAGRASSD